MLGNRCNKGLLWRAQINILWFGEARFSGFSQLQMLWLLSTANAEPMLMGNKTQFEG